MMAAELQESVNGSDFRRVKKARKGKVSVIRARSPMKKKEEFGQMSSFRLSSENKRWIDTVVKDTGQKISTVVNSSLDLARKEGLVFSLRVPTSIEKWLKKSGRKIS